MNVNEFTRTLDNIKLKAIKLSKVLNKTNNKYNNMSKFNIDDIEYDIWKENGKWLYELTYSEDIGCGDTENYYFMIPLEILFDDEKLKEYFKKIIIKK